MAHSHLATYLNDHLAGSVGLMEMLEHLQKASPPEDISAEVANLQTDIGVDRGVLERLMERLGIKQSATRKASAWAGEKLARLKLHLDDGGDGDLRLLEVMEAAYIGITGKLCLWRALRTVAAADPKLVEDYDDLERRAKEQRHRVDTIRLRAAKLALPGEA